MGSYHTRVDDEKEYCKPPLRYFLSLSELSKHWLLVIYITILFRNSRRISSAARPGKYECDSNVLTCTFAKAPKGNLRSL